MKKKTAVILTFLAALVCVIANIYWLLHKDLNPQRFIMINIITGIVLLMLIVTATNKKKV